MFPAEDGKWEPYKVRKVEKKKAEKPASNGDVEMNGQDVKKDDNDGDESEYEEDLESDDGAVYPIVGKWPSFHTFRMIIQRRI